MAVRPIDANAMLNELRPVSFEAEHSAVLLSDVSKMMREWVERQPTLTPPNEWISVEERLPGVSGNYICAVKDKNGSVWTIPAEWSLEMKMWLGAFGEIKNIVTHWMPLPAPPDRRPPEGEEDT